MTRDSLCTVRALVAAAAAALALGAAAGTARAQQDTISVGLFAPTAPFDASAQKLDFITSVADHLAGAARGKRVVGRPYSSAKEFAAAVKKNEIQFAVIDGPYAAARGLPYRILAAAVRSGQATGNWQLVASGSVKTLSDLKGRPVAVPDIGARGDAFVTNVLLGGEVEASFFGKIENAPNPNSAATMVSLGRVDAAFVPAGTTLPGGVRSVMSLESVGWPMFVALPSADKALVDAFDGAIKSYNGGGAFNRFASADDGNYRGLKGSFGQTRKRGMMTVPKPARLAVRDILGDRTAKLPRSDVAVLVQAPATVAAKNE